MVLASFPLDGQQPEYLLQLYIVNISQENGEGH